MVPHQTILGNVVQTTHEQPQRRHPRHPRQPFSWRAYLASPQVYLIGHSCYPTTSTAQTLQRLSSAQRPLSDRRCIRHPCPHRGMPSHWSITGRSAPHVESRDRLGQPWPSARLPIAVATPENTQTACMHTAGSLRTTRFLCLAAAPRRG